MQTTRSCSRAADKNKTPPDKLRELLFYAGGGGLPRTERQPAGLIARPAKQGRAVRPAHTPQIKNKTPPDKLGKFSFLCRWWGSNPHVLLAQGILSPPRLPFRHTGASFFERLLLYRILWVKSRGSFTPFSNRPARRKIHNSGSCPAARAVLH